MMAFKTTLCPLDVTTCMSYPFATGIHNNCHRSNIIRVFTVASSTASKVSFLCPSPHGL
jgi:hypothetical protein